MTVECSFSSNEACHVHVVLDLLGVHSRQFLSLHVEERYQRVCGCARVWHHEGELIPPVIGAQVYKKAGKRVVLTRLGAGQEVLVVVGHADGLHLGLVLGGNVPDLGRLRLAVLPLLRSHNNNCGVNTHLVAFKERAAAGGLTLTFRENRRTLRTASGSTSRRWLPSPESATRSPWSSRLMRWGLRW